MPSEFRRRLASATNERERLQAQREYEARRSQGTVERARQRQAQLDEKRRASAESERTSRRENLGRNRAQADVERFNRPSRIVPYEERLPTAPEGASRPAGGGSQTPGTATGGGGGGQPPGQSRALTTTPGGSNLPVPSGSRELTLQNPLRQMQVGGSGGPMTPAARGAGAAATVGPMVAGFTDEEVRRRRAEANQLRALFAEDRPADVDVQLPRQRGYGEGSIEASEQRDSERPAAATAPAQRPRPRPAARRSGGMTADELNQISLDLARGRRMGPLAPGAEQNIARAMGYKKGGLVGKKAGPAAVAKKSAAKPVAKKKGGIVGALKAKTGKPVGRPASGVKPFGTQKMAAAMQGRKPVPMPAFKKGGKVSAKGKKK